MGAIRTSDGRLVDPFNPKPEDIVPKVFIHSISQINRYTGHVKHPYSVGQHTRNLVYIVPRHLRRAALIHDWSEAWFNDLASPVKRECPEYREAEHNATHFIAEHMGVSMEELEEFDPWDKRIYINERDAGFDYRKDFDDEGRIGITNMGPWYFAETYWQDIRFDLANEFNWLFPNRAPIDFTPTMRQVLVPAGTKQVTLNG